QVADDVDDVDADDDVHGHQRVALAPHKGRQRQRHEVEGRFENADLEVGVAQRGDLGRGAYQRDADDGNGPAEQDEGRAEHDGDGHGLEQDQRGAAAVAGAPAL